MPYFMQVGTTPRVRHTQFRQPDGRLYAEELMGEEGFVSDSSLLYHRNPPTDIVSIATVAEEAQPWSPNHPLMPRHLRTHALDVKGDLVIDRQLLLGNDDVRISYGVGDSSSQAYRNAIGDELVYVESGTGRLDSVFGSIEIGPGDYVIIPTSTTHRWVAHEDDPLRALVIESRGHIKPPGRYLSHTGQFIENAPFTELDLRRPHWPPATDGDLRRVLVRNRNGLSLHTLRNDPFDVDGWFGCLYPYAFNIKDFSPVTGSLHRPPPVHQTFEGPGFVVCSFVPRPFDFHPQAVPVPPYHANVDSDEVLFYAGGSFMSRRGTGIEQGSVSLHPAGFIHGPHPGSVEAALAADGTDETAVMVDTFAPLRLGAAAAQCEDTDYWTSWHES